MKKKIIYCTILLLTITLYSTLVFAEDNNSIMKNASDSVRNMIGGAENTIENAARSVTNTSQNVTGNMQNAGNS